MLWKQHFCHIRLRICVCHRLKEEILINWFILGLLLYSFLYLNFAMYIGFSMCVCVCLSV